MCRFLFFGVIARGEAPKQSQPSRSLPLLRGGHGVGSEIASLPLVARNDTLHYAF